MRTTSTRLMAAAALGLMLAAFFPSFEGRTWHAAAQDDTSKLPLPRFVSLKSARVNLRVGPGRDYAVSWLYLKRGLPVEIVQEYDLWRRVRDSEGTEGWVYHSLLTGERTAIAAPWLKGKSATIDVHRSPADDAPLVAQMEPGVVTHVEECSNGWCEIKVADRDGFVQQHEIWGVYPDERF
ncbi:SH3 domain-containing protein [Mangrovibrevibacter kandeliae]|uniref:SH3 domain-containing protein n=1 Tax=Mangrovibrevibacter kandeliae TaxID=2968473 RepID=UPI002119151C|nr:MULTISPECIES: SH3 domain-containing protein [unclassified Aurantimonas]MCQ8782991.1 SH3 domain-containing protein [Aurantimonas sp. CSK15Z-1]MCW4115817.1 SH3 domain-containing protein [Aurantimonas sp. MSK8Z-1]